MEQRSDDGGGGLVCQRARCLVRPGHGAVIIVTGEAGQRRERAGE